MSSIILFKMRLIEDQIKEIQEGIKRKPLWYRILHHLQLTEESTEQHYLRIEWLDLEKIYNY